LATEDKNALSESIKAFQNGNGVILVDDLAPTPFGVLAIPASAITAEQVSLLVNEGRGIVIAALSAERAQELGLSMMCVDSAHSCDFPCTVSVEARHGVTTGISSEDRAQTLRVLANTTSPKRDIVTPGHIFPVKAARGGVLVKDSIWEAVVDLTKLSGMVPVTALSHILDKDGCLMGVDAIKRLRVRLSLPLINVSDIVVHRLGQESIIEQIACTQMPTSVAGNFRAFGFRSLSDNAEHLALVCGAIDERDSSNLQKPVPVRVQAESPLGDLLGNDPESGFNNLNRALKTIADSGRGVFVYIRHPRQGLLTSEVAALGRKKQSGLPKWLTRERGIGSQILRQIGVERVTLLSNTQKEVVGTELFGLDVVSRQGY